MLPVVPAPLKRFIASTKKAAPLYPGAAFFVFPPLDLHKRTSPGKQISICTFLHRYPLRHPLKKSKSITIVGKEPTERFSRIFFRS